MSRKAPKATTLLSKTPPTPNSFGTRVGNGDLADVLTCCCSRLCREISCSYICLMPLAVCPESRRLCSLSFSPATSSAGVLDSLDCPLPSLRPCTFCCLEDVGFIVEQLEKSGMANPCCFVSRLWLSALLFAWLCALLLCLYLRRLAVCFALAFVWLGALLFFYVWLCALHIYFRHLAVCLPPLFAWLCALLCRYDWLCVSQINWSRLAVCLAHSPTLFGLYVDGLEKHLLETADIDAPTLRAVCVPLLLYADDFILMSTTAAGLELQLNALASFCGQRRLTVNLSKTKVVVSEPSAMQAI